MEIVVPEDGHPRCWWGASTPDYVDYHDSEWGFGVSDDNRLFEKICLEGFQSGLSWLTILRKRENFRNAFAGFDPVEVAAYDARDIDRLLGDAGIVRHRGKITSTINNASRALETIDEFGSLAGYFYRWFEPDCPPPVSLEPTTAASHVRERSCSTAVCLHAGDGVGQRPSRRVLGSRRCGILTPFGGLAVSLTPAAPATSFTATPPRSDVRR